MNKRLIPLKKNFKVMTFTLDAAHSTLPHSVLPITTCDRFPNRGIAETLDFDKDNEKLDQRMPGSTKSFPTNNEFFLEYILYSTLI